MQSTVRQSRFIRIPPKSCEKVTENASPKRNYKRETDILSIKTCAYHKQLCGKCDKRIKSGGSSIRTAAEKLLVQPHPGGDTQGLHRRQQGVGILPGAPEGEIHLLLFGGDGIVTVEGILPESCRKWDSWGGGQPRGGQGQLLGFQRQVQPNLPTLPGGQPGFCGHIQGHRGQKHRAVQLLGV